MRQWSKNIFVYIYFLNLSNGKTESLKNSMFAKTQFLQCINWVFRKRVIYRWLNLYNVEIESFKNSWFQTSNWASLNMAGLILYMRLESLEKSDKTQFLHVKPHFRQNRQFCTWVIAAIEAWTQASLFRHLKPHLLQNLIIQKTCKTARLARLAPQYPLPILRFASPSKNASRELISFRFGLVFCPGSSSTLFGVPWGGAVRNEAWF